MMITNNNKVLVLAFSMMLLLVVGLVDADAGDRQEVAAAAAITATSSSNTNSRNRKNTRNLSEFEDSKQECKTVACPNEKRSCLNGCRARFNNSRPRNKQVCKFTCLIDNYKCMDHCDDFHTTTISSRRCVQRFKGRKNRCVSRCESAPTTVSTLRCRRDCWKDHRGRVRSCTKRLKGNGGGGGGDPECCKCFDTREELKSAVNQYIAQPVAGSNVAKKYGFPIGDWCFSNSLTDMRNLFKGKEFFNDDIRNWDVKRIEKFQGMFKGATSFDRDLSQWDMGKATNARGMFHGATAFKQDLCNWGNTMNSGTNVTNMFTGTSCDSKDDPVLTPIVGPFCANCTF